MNDTSLIPKTLGEFLGEGKKRAVYAHPERDDLVVKKLKLSKKRHRKYVAQSANRREKEMFDALDGREEQKWFARVYAVSHDGVYLVMERLKPVSKPPESYPDWLDEAEVAFHWGVSRDGNIKQCDYEGSGSHRKFLNHFGFKK